MAQGIFSFLFFFTILKFQINNPIVFSPDNTNTLWSACDETRSIINRNISRLI